MTQEIPLTRQEKIAAFKSATSSLMHWYAAQLKQGMTDAQLEDALRKTSLALWADKAALTVLACPIRVQV